MKITWKFDIPFKEIFFKSWFPHSLVSYHHHPIPLFLSHLLWAAIWLETAVGDPIGCPILQIGQPIGSSHSNTKHLEYSIKVEIIYLFENDISDILFLYNAAFKFCYILLSSGGLLGSGGYIERFSISFGFWGLVGFWGYNWEILNFLWVLRDLYRVSLCHWFWGSFFSWTCICLCWKDWLSSFFPSPFRNLA